MAANDGFPVWLLEGKAVVRKAQEWKQFVEKLQDAVDLHLAENHVPDFRDLSPSEKLLFIERAAKSIQTSVTYDAIYDQASLALDQQINNDVAKEMRNSYSNDTKTDLLMDRLRDGSILILRRWPEMKCKLHMCLNISLPEKLRTIVWMLFFTNAKMRHNFMEEMRVNPNQLVSMHDRIISEKCDQILRIQNTFYDLRPPNLGSIYFFVLYQFVSMDTCWYNPNPHFLTNGALSAMRMTLSFYHESLKTDKELHHVYFLLILPLLQVNSLHLNKTKPAASGTIALVVDMFFGLLRDAPTYIADIDNAHSSDSKSFAEKVAYHLDVLDKELVKALVEKAIMEEEKTEELEGTVKQQVLVNVIREVIGPLIMSLFVGFLNNELLLFVWDQYVIGLDVGGYHIQFLSSFTAVLLLMLRDDILKCADKLDVISVVQKESVKLNVKLVQHKMRQLFYKKLHSELNQDDKAAVPVINPLHATAKSWTHWNNEILPNRTRPLERQLARETRETERKRAAEKKVEEDANRSIALIEQQQTFEEKLREALDQERLENEHEKQRLADMLEQERIDRREKECKYEEELAQLSKEIDDIRRNNLMAAVRTPSFDSIGTFHSAIMAPPPTRATIHPERKSSLLPQKQRSSNKPVQPVSGRSDDLSAKDIMLDLIKTISNKYNKLAHGEGMERTQLDTETQQYVRSHKDYIEEAELEVFGRRLEPGEFEQMSVAEKQAKSNEMMEVVRLKLESSREHEI